jgi:flagellar basal-body rod protein FlgC
MKPVFRTVMDGQGRATVAVDRIATRAPPRRKGTIRSHPLADRNGDVWEAAVDSAAELVEMLETARQYQNNVQVLQTAKGLISDTLRMGQ